MDLTKGKQSKDRDPITAWRLYERRVTTLYRKLDKHTKVNKKLVKAYLRNTKVVRVQNLLLLYLGTSLIITTCRVAGN